MRRLLFCEISPLTYQISTQKERLHRRLKDSLSPIQFARTIEYTPLPVAIYRHNSLIRRQLGNVDMTLQENKAVNLSIAAKKLNGILIKPQETFSFWQTVGAPILRKGYREGLTIAKGEPAKGVGGGLCQMSNLIHWMILHTPLTITEHHHHDGIDLFPDYNRQIPFGTGTSILYNYLDYRIFNPTANTYQLLIHTNETHLCGELRAIHPQPFKYHITSEDAYFSKEDGMIYRNGKVYRITIDPITGNHLEKVLIRNNHARVAYPVDPNQVIEKPLITTDA